MLDTKIERSQGSATQGASIGRNTQAMEESKAIGRYGVECVGPVEEFRTRYVLLRDRILSFKQMGKVRKFLQRANIARTLSEFAAIPLEVKWIEAFDNLVTTVGKNDMLDKYLAGSSYTAAWYIGLIGSTSYTTGAAVGDTMSSHGGWVEDVEYSQAARVTTAWSAAAAGSKALSSACVYSINGDGTTIKGCFLTTVSTKSGTTGILFSAGLFTGGDKILANGDTLNVSYTATLT